MNCAICGVRKPKRHCVAVNGDICSVCCGTEREQSIDCPFHCDYLREAHKHERPRALDPASIPNADIEIPDEFLQENEWLVVLLGSAVVDGAQQVTGAKDLDIREALESLMLFYRGRAPEAAGPLAETVRARVEDIRARIVKAYEADTSEDKPDAGAMQLTDERVLRVVAFLQRLELSHNNGRAFSRAYLDFLTQFHAPMPAVEEFSTTEATETVEPTGPANIP